MRSFFSNQQLNLEAISRRLAVQTLMKQTDSNQEIMPKEIAVLPEDWERFQSF